MSRHKPRKSLGQHWLVDQSVLERIVIASNIKSTDTILEIGPGKGFLTEKLLSSQASNVYAIEIDRELVPFLVKKFSCNDKFSITEGDFLREDLTFPNQISPNKVVANIPYNITGPILERLLGKLGYQPISFFSRLVLLVQKEFADRILAKPSESTFSALSVRVQLMSIVREVCSVDPTSFMPPPKVDSKVIVLEPIELNKRLPQKTEIMIDRLLRTAFMSRRKKLKNTLSKIISSEDMNSISKDLKINLEQRPQELSLQNWTTVANFLTSL